MAGTPTVYVICDQNCKFEGMTKEQILTAIMQAVEGGEIKDVDAGFITTIKTINGTPLKFFVGEQAEYNALTAEERKNLFAIITNDTTKEGLFNTIEALQTDFESVRDGLADGKFVVMKAENAKEADKADKADDLAHLYYHKCKFTIPCFLEEGSMTDPYGNIVFEFEFTSPKNEVNNTIFLMSNKGTKLYWKGVYYPNDTTYNDKYEVTDYTYLGLSDNERYYKAKITLATGAVQNFVFFDFERERSTIELY